MNSYTSDTDLISSCVKGEPIAQRQLFEQFYSLGMSICLRYARNADDAKEILSDSYIRVFKKIKQYNPSYPFSSWFRRIIIHAVSDYYRYKKEPFLDIDNVLLIPTSDDPINNLAHEEIMNLIQTLPLGMRLCFNLFVIDGYKHAEIAQMLGISEGTSKSNLAMAKKKLRSLISITHRNRHIS